jgi:hypothetical protein
MDHNLMQAIITTASGRASEPPEASVVKLGVKLIEWVCVALSVPVVPDTVWTWFGSVGLTCESDIKQTPPVLLSDRLSFPIKKPDAMEGFVVGLLVVAEKVWV